MEPAYVELRCATCFSFLRGASHPEEIVDRAKNIGHQRLAIADHDGLYGVVRAYNAAKAAGVEIIVGSEVHFDVEQRGHDGRSPALVLLAMNRDGYGRLSKLITLGRRRAGKGGFLLRFDDVAEHADDLMAIHVGPLDALLIAKERDVFGDRLALSVERTLSPFDRLRIEAVQSASARFQLPTVATGGVLIHERSRKPLQDIMSCVRLGVTLDEGGRRLAANTNIHLKTIEEMRALFADLPEALEMSVEIADRCQFRLDELHQSFALEVLPLGETGMTYLAKLVDKGATERYPDGVPSEVRKQIDHEMQLIEELDFSGYFLTVWDIVRFARSRNILCQGRGSAANSAVCFCLGITSIDPVRMNLLFERFISAERGEPPDIDVDFEHDRREEVIQYVYEKYGREHAAMVANFICYRGKLAYREVGKVFGLGLDQIDKLTRGRGHWSAGEVNSDELRGAGLDPNDHIVQQVVDWGETLQGFPRHLGLHSGGFVITKDPLIEIVPVENATKEYRTVVAWDKRDVETLGLVKIDLLALGILSALHRCFDFVRDTEGIELSLADIPAEVPEVYDMICDADTVGTFQVESRAQMQMLPRLKPRTFYDIVVSVAIVRPGPIQGDMIHPYLRRRNGEEEVEYPHPALEKILGRTYGVPLFQEQVMKMAVSIAGFTPGEADELRRAIGWSSQIHIDRLRDRLIDGMLRNGLEQEYAERVFRMIQGFGGYGFPESHAASFGLISYASCYVKRYHPAAFVAGLLNSQPMGFYAPHTLVADAQRHGVEVRPPCIEQSFWDSTLEEGSEGRAARWWESSPHGIRQHSPWADRVRGRQERGAAVQSSVRLGFREIYGMSEEQAVRIADAREDGAFEGVEPFVDRCQLPRDVAARLAASGAMSVFGISRREALWRVMAMDRRSPLFAGVGLPDEEKSGQKLPPMSATDTMRADYATIGLSVNAHPMSLVRDEMKRRGIFGFLDLERVPHGKRVRVGGKAVTRQRPGTASGVIFMTLEDEDGHMNLVVFTHVYERYRDVARDEIMLVAHGQVQRTGDVLNVIVDHFAKLEVPEPGVAVGRNFF